MDNHKTAKYIKIVTNLKKKNKYNKSKRQIKKKINFKTIRLYSVSVIFLSLSLCIYKYFDNIYDFCNNILIVSSSYLGFNIENINIEGERDHIGDIPLKKGDNIFIKSSHNIKDDIMKNPWIKSVVVVKKLPNTINILIEKKKPIAIYQKNDNFFLVSKEGDIITSIKDKENYNFPIITGENSPKNIDNMLSIIDKFYVVKKKLNSLSFVRNRRWDLIVSSGIIVKLPEENIEHALEILSIILKEYNINRNTVKYIDLRIPENIILGGMKLKSESINKKTV